MFIKDLNLYINEKNIVTLRPYATVNEYGLDINGIRYRLGGYMQADEKLQKAKLGKMKSICTNLIKKADK